MNIKIPRWYLLLGPTLLLGFGYFLNAAVVAANHGTMPVLTDCTEAAVRWALAGDTIHSCMTKASHLKAIADWFFIPGIGTASPGDFFEWLGETTQGYGLVAWLTLLLKDINPTL